MNKIRILVVDDEPHLVRSLTFIMSREGHEVFTAADGKEALQKAVEHRPELVFLDIMMPRKNGYEVCEAIRQIPELKDTYIIMLSAKGREIDREKALKAGANEFMSKPFSPLEVVARVKSLAPSLCLTQRESVVK
jgi:DNA-binding response OmpR family regulator